MNPTCTLTVGFDANAQNEDGSTIPGGFACHWTFSDGTTSNNCDGTKPAGGGIHSGTVLVTSNESGCTDSATSNQVEVFGPLAVEITPSTTGDCCDPDMASDAITYTASPSGGDGSFSFAWNIPGCGNSATCTVNPADNDFCADQPVFVTLDDGNTLCPPTVSETEIYSKRTTISSTNNL